MPDEQYSDKRRFSLSEQLAELKPKAKSPASMSMLNKWIAEAERRLGTAVKGGRLGWLIASSVAVAAVQRATDEQGEQLFLIKGGTLLLHRLNAIGRPTKDVDGLIRGSLDGFFEKLEGVLDEPWGPLTLRRSEIVDIEVPSKRIKPRSFEIILEFKGETWRRIRFEVSPDEAGIGQEPEKLTPPALGVVGLPSPDALVGIALKNQIAQKLHAASAPHDPPSYKNTRARDAVDLLLLRDLVTVTGAPTIGEIRESAERLFIARAEEAEQMGFKSHTWPCRLAAYPHWVDDYKEAASSAGIELSLDEAISQINDWIDTIVLSR